MRMLQMNPPLMWSIMGQLPLAKQKKLQWKLKEI